MCMIMEILHFGRPYSLTRVLAFTPFLCFSIISFLICILIVFLTLSSFFALGAVVNDLISVKENTKY